MPIWCARHGTKNGRRQSRCLGSTSPLKRRPDASSGRKPSRQRSRRLGRERCVLQFSKGAGERPIELWYRYRPPARFTGRRTVPLIVFLHGAGQRGNDNVTQLRALPTAFCDDDMKVAYPCAILAPQCPKGTSWSSPIDGESDFLDGVIRLIDNVLLDSRIDPSRVYLTGL